MKKLWKEMMRDLLAFGSLPFYLLVLVRAWIGLHKVFVYQMLIAAVLLYLFSRAVKNTQLHIARGLILVAFTSLFYQQPSFTAFAIFVWLLMIYATMGLKMKMVSLAKGIALGLLSAWLAYLAAPYLVWWA